MSGKTSEGIVCCVLTHRCDECPYHDTVGCRSSLAEETVKQLKRSSWISIRDELPDEQTAVLVARRYIGGTGHMIHLVEIAYRVGETWYSYTDDWQLKREGDGDPYAWTPIPEAPEDEL